MDYWDHPEYGELEKKFEKQVATARKWMALHDEAVEREVALSAECSAVCEAAKCVISSSTPLDDPDPNWYMANIDDLEALERVSGTQT